MPRYSELTRFVDIMSANFVERSELSQSESAASRVRVRFTMRALLVAFFLLSCYFGWQGYQLRVLQRERAFLLGRWQQVDEHDTAVKYQGKQIIHTLDQEMCTIRLPEGDVGRIDFHNPVWSGPSLAIYRREGMRVRFAQNQVGQPRPKSFVHGEVHSTWLAVETQ